MTDDFYLIAITALLPLTALMLVLQVNPYQALVMRGIMGAIAALLYALFGAADVALTEALVGTMLSITLYAVAVRSSMEMRLGWVQPVTPTSAVKPSQATAAPESPDSESLDPKSPATEGVDFLPPLVPTQDLNGESYSNLDEALVTALRKALKPHHLRLELLSYPSLEALEIALNSKRIHSAVFPPTAAQDNAGARADLLSPYRVQTRVKRLYELLSDRLPPSFAEVHYWNVVHPSSAQSPAGQPDPSLPQSSAPHSVQESP